MKKVLKNRLFLVLVTAIIVGSIAVYATSEILASQITYNDTTVEAALNDLYGKANKNITFGSPIYSENNYNGDQLESKTITQTLNKGKYIVSVNYA